jgi:hypothetical protein
MQEQYSVEKESTINQPEVLSEVEQKEKTPLEIGGWLFLVAIGVVVGPIRMVMLLLETYPPIFTEGTWGALTTVGSDFYSPIWGPFLVSEILINVALLSASIYLMFLFFNKKASVPKWYGGISIFSIIFIVIDAYVVTLVLPEAEFLDADTVKELMRSMVSCLIWTPYLYISQRAKNTFIR